VARTISKFETLTDSSIISSNSVNFVPFIGFLTMNIIILNIAEYLRQREKLKDAISQKVLKHYILNNHNLFHNKFATLDLRRTIVDKIDSVMNHFISSLLECQLPFQEDNARLHLVMYLSMKKQ
jgi:purine-cytosine permease-like protein